MQAKLDDAHDAGTDAYLYELKIRWRDSAEQIIFSSSA